MKKTLFTLMIMLLPMMVQADFLGLKKADEFITMRVITLDSSGIRTKPDSVHVFTYLDGGTALQFNTRSTTYPFAIGIDTSKIYGDTTYWFIDQIQDIDGTPTPTDYTLTINIVMWGDGGIPTDNWGTVQVLSDSLDVYLDEIRDTTFGTIDTLQLQDDWVAREASLYDPATDSVIVDFSIWNTKDPEVTVVTNNDKTGYTLTAAGYVAGADTTLKRALSDTTTGSIFAKIMRDASAASAQAIANNADIGKVIDTANAIIDTLQLQDNWIAREATLAAEVGNIDGWNPITDNDSLIIDNSSLDITTSLSAADIVAIADTVFKRDSSDVNAGAATSFGTLMMKPAYVQGSASGLDTTDIKTLMNQNWTSAAGGAGWANMLADTNWLLDTTGNKIATGFGNILAKINDTAEAQDGWVAKEASLGDSSATIFDEILNSYTTMETFGAAMLGLVPKQDSVKDSTANSASAFKTTLSGGDMRTQHLVFYTGSNAGSGRTIISYNNISGFVTLDTAFGQPVNVLDRFAILGARSSRIDLAGYAGINFDRATGDISAAQIEADAITAAHLATNSITAEQIDGTFREEIWNIPFSDAATAAGSMWDSLNNSSYVQGASGLDSATLAGWVWNTPQSNHTTAGTFGKYLDLEISGIGTGSGAYSYQLVTYDSTTSQVIPGTNLAVRNINQSALIATGKSDLLGFETFNLDADSFIIVATSPGYIYQTFDTLIVTGAGIDTVFGDQFDPGSPVLPALCRVYGYLYSVSAVPEKDAVVRAFLPAGVAQSGNLIISPFMVTTTSDSSGYFYLDLIRSDSLVPAATQYDLIIERSDGTIVHKRITVPDSTSWQLDW